MLRYVYNESTLQRHMIQLPYILEYLKVLLLTHMCWLKGATFDILFNVVFCAILVKTIVNIVISAQYSHLVQRCLVESLEVRGPVLLHYQLSVPGVKLLVFHIDILLKLFIMF